MKNAILLLALLLSGCVRSSSPQTAIQEEDKSILFPEFDTALPIRVGEQGRIYELDGVTLRAIVVAANDYMPPDHRGKDCWERQEAQEYRVIRRGDIVFVEIGVNPNYCKMGGMLLDNGLRYAISTEGRILRRLATGEPDGSRRNPSDAGVEKSYPVSEQEMDILLRGAGAPSFIPPQWRKDGGSAASLEPQPRSSGALDGGVPDGG